MIRANVLNKYLIKILMMQQNDKFAIDLTLLVYFIEGEKFEILVYFWR
jgi:hypothetical protein